MGLLSRLGGVMRGGGRMAASAADSGMAAASGAGADAGFMANKEALASQIGDPMVADMIRQARDYNELGSVLEQIRRPFGRATPEPANPADISPYAPRNEISPYVR